ncbi:MAG: outer membrane beta-barrel protein [Bacteroides sp.]
MKKGLFLFFALIAMACGSAFAQLAVDGQLGFNYGSAGNDSRIAFRLLPGLSYELNSDIALGGRIGFDYNASSTSSGEEQKEKSSATKSDFIFHVVPYVRYFALGNDRLKLFCDAQLPLSFGSVGASKVTAAGKTTSTDGNGVFGVGLQLVPGLKYELTNQIALIATANVVRFGVMYNSTSVKVGDKTVTTSSTSFGLGINHAGYEKSAAPFMVGCQFSF